MKKTIILFVACVAQALDVRTACASGCTYSTAQAAVNAVEIARAAACDTYIIELTAGQSYAPFSLPAYTGTCTLPIIIRTSRVSELPAGRVGPANLTLMPDVVMGVDGYGIRIATVAGGGARHWIFDGIGVVTNPSFTNYVAVYGEQDTGNGTSVTTQKSRLASDIEFRRMYVRNATPNLFFGRGFGLNGVRLTVEDSYIDGPIADEPQAVQTCECEHCTVRNNYMRASGEAVLVGGCGAGGQHKSRIAGHSFHNIRVLGNRTEWNPNWKINTTPVAFGSLPALCFPGEQRATTTGTGTYATCNAGGASWTDSQARIFTIGMQNKNHFDVKACRECEFIGNWSRYGWIQAQNGQGMIVNSSTGDQVYDLRYEWNRVQDLPTMFNAGISELWRPVIRHNQAWNMSPPGVGGGSQARHMIGLHVSTDLTIEHNSLHLHESSDGVATVIAVTDDRPTNSAANGGKGRVVWRDNAAAGPSATYSSTMLGGSSWGLPGSWCYLTVPLPSGLSGWIMPGGSFSWSGHVWGGTVASSGTRPLTGTTCDQLVSGVVTTFPVGTTVKATAAEVFTDAPAGDLTPAAGLGVNGADGRPAGAWAAGVAAMTGSALTGARNPYLDFSLTSARQTADGEVTVEYVPVTGQACAVTASTAENFASTTGTVVNTPSSGRSVVAGLTAGTRYVRLTCGDAYEDKAVLVQ